MNNNILELKKKFYEIKKMGLVESRRKGTTGMGYTFESLLGKEEDCNSLPDYKGIEIKTKYGYSKNNFTLFSLRPIGMDDYQIKRLVDNYGYVKWNSNYKAFRADANSLEKQYVGLYYQVKLKVNRDTQKIYLYIYDRLDRLIDKESYWTFSEIVERLVNKMSYLAIVHGYPYEKNDRKYYRYTDMYIYSLIGDNRIIDLIENGIISVTFNAGYEKGRDGSIYLKDHGTSFRIKEKDLKELYKKI